MADDNINIEITANDMASDKIRAVGDAAKKTGEAGKLGFFALGEAAENAAQKMGVPNQVSRQLGNSVERMSSSLGVAGIALGAVGLAASSAVLIWQKYREEQEKIREEKIKAGQMAGTWITGILEEAGNTRELVKAKKEMAQAEYDINKARIEMAIPELLAKQAELQAKHTLELKRANGEAFIWVGSWEDAKKKAESYRLELNSVSAQLNMMTAQSKLFNERNKAGVVDKDENLREQSARDLKLDQERVFEERIAAIREQGRREEADRRTAEYDRQIAEDARVESLKGQAMQETLGNAAQTFQMLSQLHTSHARRYFSIYKAAAIGETIISTSRAAMKAYAEYGPTFGSVAAAAIVALGAAKIAIIRAQTFDGGGGAVGTYSANPATGLASGNSGSSGSSGTVIINVNGQKAGEYEIAGGVMRTIYNNGGSIDGFQIAVERSA